MLTYTGFEAADDSYLDPVRQMEAAANLGEARHSRDPAKISRRRRRSMPCRRKSPPRPAASASSAAQ